MLPPVAWLVMLAVSGANGLFNEPPKKSDAPTEPVVISGIENAVLTVPALTKLEFKLVNTPAGARVRVLIATPGSNALAATLEATRIKLRVPVKDGRVTLVTLQVAADGKSIDQHVEDEAPARKP